MQDRRIELSINLLIPALAALIAVGLVIGTFLGLDRHWGPVAVLFGMLASVVQIRSYLCKMGDRERNAFEMGRDSVRDIHSAGR